MIAEIGHFALVLALLVACVQAVVPLYGAWRGDARLMAVGNTSAVALILMIGVAFGALTWCYAISDFSVQNVYENSHSLAADALQDRRRLG